MIDLCTDGSILQYVYTIKVALNENTDPSKGGTTRPFDGDGAHNKINTSMKFIIVEDSSSYLCFGAS